jgi:cytochrome c oxidase assembly protein subunit 15
VRGVYVANLVGQGAIVVTGGVVRLTSSGLGCPTWPRCTAASFVPVAGQAEGWHKFVEFGNRMLTFVLVALAVLALVAALWDRSRRRRSALPPRPVLTWLAAVPILGTVAQAVLGGVTVLTGLNPIAVGSHFLLSMAIVALLTVLVRRADEPGDAPKVVVVPVAVRHGVHGLVGVLGLVVVAGMLVTASGPHAGDERTARLGADPTTMAWLHADLVLLAIGLLVGLLVALRSTASPERVGHVAMVTLLLLLAQAGVGYLQFFTGLPWAVVTLHLVGAVLVWWSAVRLLLVTTDRGVVADELAAPVAV